MKINKSKSCCCSRSSTRRGGVEVYATALECVVNPDLKKEWEKYLERDRAGTSRVSRRCARRSDIDPKTETPGRKVVRHVGRRWSRR